MFKGNVSSVICVIYLKQIDYIKKKHFIIDNDWYTIILLYTIIYYYILYAFI